MITFKQYQEVQEYKANGCTMKAASEGVGISYSRVRRLWNMGEDEAKLALRTNNIKLENYRQFILTILRFAPTTPNTSIRAQLMETFPEFNYPKTSFNRYMKLLREETGFLTHRTQNFSIRAETAPGYEAQVDFGQYRMRNIYGKEITVYFFCMILSYSRMKFVYFSGEPFTTKTAIDAHMRAFEYFGGRPQLIVYDQDRLFVSSENYGSIIFVKDFENFVKKAGYTVYVCKGSNPQTKGKVENTVKIVKHSFLDGRTYASIYRLNCEALTWLDRIANNTINSYTKKTPAEMYPQEHKVLTRIDFTLPPPAVILTVHNGMNFVEYNSNRYELPRDRVYANERIRIEFQEETLLFYLAESSELLCKHLLCKDIGQTIKLPDKKNYPRASEIELRLLFKGNRLATDFIDALIVRNSRYASNQFNSLKKVVVHYTESQMNAAMEHCLNNCRCTINELYAYLIYRYGRDTFLETRSSYLRTDVIKRSQEIREEYDGNY